MDVDSLRHYGHDFLQDVRDAIRTSSVVLVVIGGNWADAVDERRIRRLDDPDGVVRMEVEHALRHQRPVLPVLLDEAAMPRRDELPAALTTLPRLNAARVRHVSWDADIAALFRAVESLWM